MKSFIWLCKRKYTPRYERIRAASKTYKKIMIAGGGNIGLHLAQSIENNYDVKIIEANQSRNTNFI